MTKLQYAYIGSLADKMLIIKKATKHLHDILTEYPDDKLQNYSVLLFILTYIPST